MSGTKVIDFFKTTTSSSSFYEFCTIFAPKLKDIE